MQRQAEKLFQPTQCLPLLTDALDTVLDLVIPLNLWKILEPTLSNHTLSPTVEEEHLDGWKD